MKMLNLLMVAALVMVARQPVLAEGHAFPGKGESAKWDQANILFNQGITFYRASEYDKAIAKYKEATEIYPYDYEYFNNLGLAYKKKNDFAAATEALKKSIELKSNIWENWSNLGSVYKHEGHPSEAIEAYQKALLLNPPSKASNSSSKTSMR